jgi:hypothetical protein
MKLTLPVSLLAVGLGLGMYGQGMPQGKKR